MSLLEGLSQASNQVVILAKAGYIAFMHLFLATYRLLSLVVIGASLYQEPNLGGKLALFKYRSTIILYVLDYSLYLGYLLYQSNTYRSYNGRLELNIYQIVVLGVFLFRSLLQFQEIFDYLEFTSYLQYYYRLHYNRQYELEVRIASEPFYDTSIILQAHSLFNRSEVFNV